VKTDDLLKAAPEWAPARPLVGITPRLTDAELVTVAVLQALLGFTSEARWLRQARTGLRHLFGYLPKQPGYNKRLRAGAGMIGRVIRALAADTSVWTDDVRVIDSTPVGCGCSRETARRSDLAGWAEYGYCASHSRYLWGLRLHLLATLHGLLRPARNGEPERAGACLFKPLRQTIESINQTFKGQLDLERHGGHTPAGVFVRVLQRILALTSWSRASFSPQDGSGRPAGLSRPIGFAVASRALTVPPSDRRSGSCERTGKNDHEPGGQPHGEQQAATEDRSTGMRRPALASVRLAGTDRAGIRVLPGMRLAGTAATSWPDQPAGQAEDRPCIPPGGRQRISLCRTAPRIQGGYGTWWHSTEHVSGGAARSPRYTSLPGRDPSGRRSLRGNTRRAGSDTPDSPSPLPSTPQPAARRLARRPRPRPATAPPVRNGDPLNLRQRVLVLAEQCQRREPLRTRYRARDLGRAPQRPWIAERGRPVVQDARQRPPGGRHGRRPGRAAGISVVLVKCLSGGWAIRSQEHPADDRFFHPSNGETGGPEGPGGGQGRALVGAHHDTSSDDCRLHGPPRD
jgi:hypothetical protein